MGLVYGAVMVATLGVSAVTLARALASPSVVDVVLITFLVGSAEILLSGYLLSGLGAFGSIPAWAAAGVLWLALSLIIVRRQPPYTPSAQLSWSQIRSRVRRLSGVEKIVFLAPAALVAVLGAVNLVSALVVAPNTVDGLTYHLARVGYYLQHGHLGYFEANYPVQAIHAKGSVRVRLLRRAHDAPDRPPRRRTPADAADSRGNRLPRLLLQDARAGRS